MTLPKPIEAATLLMRDAVLAQEAEGCCQEEEGAKQDIGQKWCSDKIVFQAWLRFRYIKSCRLEPATLQHLNVWHAGRC